MEPEEIQVIPSPTLLTIAAYIVATAGPLYHPDLHLYANPVTLTNQTILGQLTEATFTGYSKVTAMVWGASYYDVDGTVLTFGTSHSFVATDAVTPNTIYGYYLTDSTDMILLAAYALATPVGIPGAGSGITVLPTFRYSGN